MARAAFLCEGLRTPIGRYGGALARVRPDDLAAHVLRAVLAAAPGLDPAAIDDVIFGCANQAGEDNRNVARMAVLLSGLPETVPGAHAEPPLRLGPRRGGDRRPRRRRGRGRR
jgi:acetyl-CoA acyltransferase